MADVLMPHQVTAAAFLAARGPALLWDDMGLGKTISAIAGADQAGCQKILVCCPAAVRPMWARSFERWQQIKRPVDIVEGNPKTSPNGGVTIISHAAFANAPSVNVLRQAAPYDAFIMDECFPSDTLIDTDRGKLSIGRIVDENMNIKVLSFNSRLGIVEAKSVVRWIRKTGATKMVEVFHERGSFVCTAEHKIFVGVGRYKKASLLTATDTLCFLPNTVYANQTRLEVLYKKVQSGLSSEQNVCQGYRNQNLRSMQQAFRHSITSQYEAAHMFPAVRLSASYAESRRSGSVQSAYSAILGRLQRDKKSSFFSAHEVKQPHERSGGTCQGNSGAKGSTVSYRERRQWQDYAATTETGRRFTDTYGACDKHQRCTKSVCENSVQLQGRLSHTGTYDSHRSRRAWAHAESETTFGRKKDSSFERVRVVGVKVLEPGDRSESGFMSSANNTVYDLEVADNHNYVADGVLVSNCHGFRTYDAQRVRSLLSLGDGAWRWSFRFWGLTGTPIVNSAADLWPVLAGPFYYGETWWNYVNHFAKLKADGITPTGLRNAPELAALLRPHVLRRTLDSIGIDLPSLTINQVGIEIDIQARAAAMAELENWTPARLQAVIEANDEIKDGALSRVRHAIGIAKIVPVATYAWDLMQQNDGPIVLFFQHTEVRSQLHKILTHWGFKVSWIDGHVTPKQLGAAEAWFQEGKIDILLAQTQAAGQGLTLHRSNTSIIAELPWTSVGVQQAIKRIHRIGQTRPCTAHILRANDCWLEDVLSSVVSKKQLAADSLLNLLTSTC